MSTFYRILSAGVVSGLVFSASAAVVTVNDTVPGVPNVSYQTISEALDYVKTTSEPRVVEVVAGGPYEENLLINFDVTVRGTGFRPTIVTPPISGAPDASLDGNAIGIFTDSTSGGDITVRLENLEIIPEAGNAPSRGIRANNAVGSLTSDNMLVELVDVILSSNNGDDTAVTTDGLSLTSNGSKTSFADDGIFVTGIVDLHATGTIISNIFNGDTTSNDGLVFFPNEALHELFVGPGCVFSFMNRCGIQVATDGSILNLVGTEADPVVFTGNYQGTALKNATLAIYFDNNNLPESQITMENVVFYQNNNPAMAANFTGEGDSIPALTATNVAFVDNTDTAVVTVGEIKTAWTFTDTTFVNNCRADTTSFPEVVNFTEAIVGGSDGTITFVDSILAGNGTEGDGAGNNALQFTMPNATVSFINSAIVTAGPHSLATVPVYLVGAPDPTQTNVVNADPEFVNAEIFPAADFVDVAAAAYDNAATGGDDLSGYGDYVGTGSNVGNWSMY